MMFDIHAVLAINAVQYVIQLLGYAYITVIIPQTCLVQDFIDNFVWLGNLKVSYHGRGVDGSLAYCI